MNNKPLISVIINNCNYDRFLREAIDSVLNQTYDNYELIIVDDGSTDDSRKIIDEYYEKHPDLIKRIYKLNGGQASAFNAGFAASQGDIIAFLDSDDYWFPQKLEKIIEVHEQYGIVQHDLSKNGSGPFVRNLRNNIDFQRLLKEFGYSESNSPTSALSFSRDVLLKVFPVPEEAFKICADDFVRINALYFSDIYNIDEVLGFYRIHDSNNYCGKYDYEEKIRRQKNTKIQFNKKLHMLGLPLIPTEHYTLDSILGYSVEVESGKEYLLYGTGKASETITNITEKKGGKVRLYSDSNPEKWGGSFMGKTIIPPSQIRVARDKFHKIIIASMHSKEILESLRQLNFEEGKDIIVPLII